MSFLLQVLVKNSYASLNLGKICFLSSSQPLQSIFTLSQRYKSKRSKSVVNTEDDSEESIDDDVFTGKGTEIKLFNVSSMRTDLLLKIGLGMSRNKIEQAFYESRIRLNSKKIMKKSAEVHIGDEVDLVKGVSPSNSDFLIVGRVEVLNAVGRDDEEGINVKIRRSKALIIENYPDGDPWKHTDASS